MYGLMQGGASSRSLEERCRYDVRYGFLAGATTPDHTTLSRFRDRLASRLDGMLAQISRVAEERGLLKGKVVAVDGTKCKAAASQWLRAVQSSIEADARTMIGSDGNYLVGYNVQMAADVEGSFITCCSVTNEANDARQMEEVLRASQRQSSVQPSTVVADAGYDTSFNHGTLRRAGVTAVIVPNPRTSRVFTRDEQGILRCPGKHAASMSRVRKRGVAYDTYRVSQCRHCPLKAQCGVNGHQKEVSVRAGEDPVAPAEHGAAMDTPEARMLLKARGPTIERKFAHLKRVMDLSRFKRRSLPKVNADCKMTVLAFNLGRLLRRLEAFFSGFSRTFQCQFGRIQLGST